MSRSSVSKTYRRKVVNRAKGRCECRATVEALDMNRPRLVQLRQIWVRWGEHPPKE